MSSTAVLPRNEDGYVRKLWTMKECRFLTDNGLLEPGKYELINGEIVSKMGQGRLHIAAVTQIIVILSAIFGGEFIQSQAQVGIGEIDPYNDPEPDVAVLDAPVASFLNREPDPQTEVLLAVEASATTLRGDIRTKAALYAQYGIREYWVVSIAARELIVHRSPSADGYTDVKTYAPDQCVAPLSRPNASVTVSSLFV